MSLTPTSRNNSCAVCEDTSGKCRQGREDTDYWQCMSYSSARKGEIFNGFKCIGHTRDQLWGQFRINEGEYHEQGILSKNSRTQTQGRTSSVIVSSVQGQARNHPDGVATNGEDIPSCEEKPRRETNHLHDGERDRAIRKLHNHFGLSQRHREDLIKRGLTDYEIEHQLYFSISPNQEVPRTIPNNLPGIRYGQIKAAGTGYACVTFDPEGRATGWQIRLDDATDNKYRWAKGENSSHLANGELPITSTYPSQIRHPGIWICEGISKPAIAANKLGTVTIGAASANFTASPQQTEEHLKKAAEFLKTQEIIFAPDGGAVSNRNVLVAYKRSWELFTKLGYQVRVAWWGQIHKTDPDIDELENLSSISYITPDEFFKLSDPAPKQEQVQPQQEPAWKQRAKAEWRKNRSFSNAVQSASQWCEWDKPGANTIGFYKAGLGRGKTTRLKNWVKEWRELVEDVGFICLGYRNTLLLQLCEQLGFYHLHDKDAPLMKSDPNGGIALCVDSLWRFNPEDFDDKIIILDELKSVIKHLLHSPTVKNRDKILNLFAEAIRRSRQVICLDGLMADWCVNYLKTIAPDKQIIRAENTYHGKKPLINLLLGTIDAFDETKRVKVDDRSPWFKYLLEESAVPAVCSDSQALIEALDDIFTEKGLDVLRIDSKTVPENYVKEFLKDCNAYIEKRKPDVLLYTPSAESGVDVSIPDYFTQHFGFFFGVLDVDGILQMLGRIRDNITKFVWCKSFVSESEKQHSKSPFADVIEKSINDLLITDISTSLTDPESWEKKVISHLATVVGNSLKDVSNRVSCLVQSVQNFEKSNLRECLKEALLESGYKVRGCTFESSEEYKGKLKKETEAVKRRNASDIFNAEKVAPELVDELRFDARWEERCKVIQAKLRERLPGIDQTPVWTEDFIYHIRYEDRDFISHQEMYWLFKHPEVAKHQSQKSLHWMARRLNTFVGNVKSRWAKIYALHEMGFEQFLDPEVEWSNDSPEVVELVKQGKKHSNALGVHLGQQSNIRYLGSLLKMLGMKLKCTRKEGKDKRFYQLDQEGLTNPTRLQVLTCIENRFTQPEEKLDWESAINEAYGILPENDPLTQSGQASQPTARTPQILYRNEVSPASRNLASESQGDREVLEAAAGQKSELEQLDEALPFAESLEDFASIIEGSPLEAVEDAIALQDTQPRRLQLQRWLEAAQKPVEPSIGFKVGDCLKRLQGVFKGRIARVIEILDWGIETSLGTVAFSEMSGWELSRNADH